MASQIFDRSGNERAQPVWQPYRSPPSGYAPNQGAGPPGRPSSNQIRKVLNGRVHGTSVMPSDNSRGGSMARSRVWPPPTPQPSAAGNSYDNVGSSAGPSAPAYRAFPKPTQTGRSGRRIVRSQVAG